MFTWKRKARTLLLMVSCLFLFTTSVFASPPQGLNPSLKMKEPTLFGDGSFIADKTTFSNASEMQMSESNGYVFISWFNDRDKSPTFYTSIAKDGKWIVRNKKVFEAFGTTALAGKTDLKPYEIVNLGRTVYLSYNDEKNLRYHVQQVTLNVQGNMAVNKTIFSMPLTKIKNNITTGQIRPLYSSKGVGIILHREYEMITLYPPVQKDTTYTFFLAETGAKAFSFTDKKSALYNWFPAAGNEYVGNDPANAYWDIEKKALYVMGSSSSFVFKYDLAKNGYVLNPDGEKKSFITRGTFLLDSQYLFCFNSDTQRHWVTKFNGDTLLATAVTEYFALEDNYHFKDKVFVTATDNEIHIWEISKRVDNSISPSLKLLTVYK